MNENNQNNREYEDVYSSSTQESQSYRRGHKPVEQMEVVYPNKFLEFMGKNNKRNTKIIFAAILVFIVLFIAFLIGTFINEKLDVIHDSGEVFTGMEEEEEEFSEDFNEEEFQAMHEVSSAASLDDLLKKWHNNGGELMKQKYIINVLLVGIDGKNGVTKGGNSDSLILVSVNKKTEKITLVSFMRDSRTYFTVNGRDYWHKVNAAYARGNAIRLDRLHQPCFPFVRIPSLGIAQQGPHAQRHVCLAVRQKRPALAIERVEHTRHACNQVALPALVLLSGHYGPQAVERNGPDRRGKGIACLVSAHYHGF